MNEAKEHFRFSKEVWRKFDPRLQKEIQQRAGEPDQQLPLLFTIEGIVTSGAPRERRERMADAARGFLEELCRLGAGDVESYWINGTVSATVPLPVLGEVAARNDVKAVLLLVRQKITC